MRINRKRVYWKELCAEFVESGLSKKDFCAKHNIHSGTLYHYLYQFQPDSVKKMAKKQKENILAKKITSFLPVKYKPEEIRQEIKITLKTGHTLSFEMLAEQIPKFINKMESSFESSL